MYRVLDNVSYMLYVAESRRHECRKLQITVYGEEINALIDIGCEISILNEYLYNELRHVGLKCLELPNQRVNLAVHLFKKKKAFRNKCC